MTDIRVVWNPDQMIGDWIMRGSTLDEREALITASLVSLFTHRTADDDDVIPDGSEDRRGWWGDHEAGEIRGATPIGSRLWLISREKQTEETRARAEGYIREALQWMIDDGLCSGVDVVCEWFAFERLGATITFWRGNRDSVAVRFERLWDNLGETVT